MLGEYPGICVRSMHALRSQCNNSTSDAGPHAEMSRGSTAIGMVEQIWLAFCLCGVAPCASEWFDIDWCTHWCRMWLWAMRSIAVRLDHILDCTLNRCTPNLTSSQLRLTAVAMRCWLVCNGSAALRSTRGTRRAHAGHAGYLLGTLCFSTHVAPWQRGTAGYHILLHLISQSVYYLLQTAHVFSAVHALHR